MPPPLGRLLHRLLHPHLPTYTTTPHSIFPFNFVDNTASSNSSSTTSTTSTTTTTTTDDMSSSFPAEKSRDEWRAILSPEQFRVLRDKGTERPGIGEYNKHKADGTYTCAGCDAPLYKSTTKFDSGCGWPAFFEGVPGSIVRKEDRSFMSVRTEILCANCGGHLG